MEQLIVEGTNDLPSVNFNKEKGYLKISGSSLPENVMDVYNPLLKWLDEYTNDPNPVTTIEFFFEYLNTASSQMIMRLLEKCLELKTICNKLTINWCYTSGDLDMRDFGHELIEITNYPINIITKEHHP